MPTSNLTPECPSYYRYWGKAGTDAGDGCHLLAYHSLDVAAVGEVLVRQNDVWRHRIHTYIGTDEASVVTLIRLLTVCHDIGKFSDDFQNTRPDLLLRLRGVSSRAPYRIRHDALTALAWREIAWPLIWKDQWLCREGTRDEYGWRDDALGALAGAAAGHHGKPVGGCDATGCVVRVEGHFTAANRLAVEEFVQQLGFLRGDAQAPLIDETEGLNENANRVSWLVAGLIVLADWIGSNRVFFPFCQDVLPLAEYWRDHAIPRAKTAVAACGMLPVAPSGSSGMAWLFPKIMAEYRPSPLQELTESLPLGDGPQLVVIEDLTGAGKTEAALVLAQRLMNGGLAQGLYMGLPTMATANAMFKRVHEIHGRLFAEGETPSLVLAHSRRELSGLFRQLCGGALPSHAAHEGEEDGSVAAQTWLSDSRKKALLASVGVGTVDQALLAVLPAKHQSLRLLGVSRNVLIVDEVHACDTYMNRILRALLQFQAALGGSAILLSATLPVSTRKELVESFCEGMRQQPPVMEENGYPLLTHIGGTGRPELRFDPRADSARTVCVRLIGQPQEAIAVIREAAAGGRCACWIRNTVQDAIDGTDLLNAAGLREVDLFHARFAMGDRLNTEDRVLARYDERSGPADRAGRAVVATQVVEQSLDLDFDVMVSDLCPMDLIIQRSGRLCRHARDREGNRIRGADRRGTPMLHVLAPPIAESPPSDWFKGFLPGAAAVYPNHGQLWLTAKLLAERGAIAMPENARLLIEGVYGATATATIPVTLAGIQSECEGRRMAQATIAEQNKLKLNEGYERTWQNWLDDRITPTRLGEDSVTLRLARWEAGVLAPWFKAPENAWAMSEVSVRWAAVQAVCLSSEEQKGVEAAKAAMPDGGQWCIVVPLREEDGRWVAQVQDAQGNLVVLRYHPRTGLAFERPIGKE